MARGKVTAAPGSGNGIPVTAPPRPCYFPVQLHHKGSPMSRRRTLPPCLQPLAGRSDQHELLAGVADLPGLHGVIQGFPYRFSFVVLDADDADADSEVVWRYIMDFPFGFEVRVRQRAAAKTRKSKGKGKARGKAGDPPAAPADAGGTGIAAFDERFEAEADDVDLGRALPWLRDRDFLDLLGDLCRARQEVRLSPDSLHVRSAPRALDPKAAAAAIVAGDWPDDQAIEVLAAAVTRLHACLKRLAPATTRASGARAEAPVLPPAPAPVPPPPLVPPAPAPQETYELVFDGGTPDPPPAEIVFLGEPQDRAPGRSARPSAPSAQELVRIGFDDPPATPSGPPSARGGRHAGDAWSSTWELARLPQFAALLQRCPTAVLVRDSEGRPDITGVIDGIPLAVRLRWQGGRRNLADATDFSFEMDAGCKSEFEACVYRESLSLRFRQIFGSVREFKVGRPALDEKYYLTCAGGSQGRFSDLILDTETELLVDRLTELCGVVKFYPERILLAASDRDITRPKSNYDPIGEGAWPPRHFFEQVLPAAIGLAVRVNGLDNGLIYRRMRTY